MSLWKLPLLLGSILSLSSSSRISQPLILSSNSVVPSCENECQKFYSYPIERVDQINDSWSICLRGCEFFSRLEAQFPGQPTQALKNCNFSCDERFWEEDVQVCEAGCGFGFNEVTNTVDEVEAVPRIESTSHMMTMSLPSLMNQVRQMVPTINRIVERTLSTTFDDEEGERQPRFPGFSSFPSFSFSFPRPSASGMFGRREDDEVEPIFDRLFDAMDGFTNRMPAMPMMESMRSWNPFSMLGGRPSSGGKMFIMKSGPGYVEEKQYDILPNGEVVEVLPERTNDALHHHNPMDTNFDANDVEILDIEAPSAPEDETAPLAIDVNSEVVAEHEAAVPLVEVMDEAAEAVEAEVEAEKDAEEDKFLSVINNSIEESKQLLEERFQQYNTLKDAEYRDNNSCASQNMRWSDWVACVHVRLGVPRWLTAATIAFGIIFAVWLCLVIPSAAPKQRIRNLVMKVEKLSPPVAVIKAGENSTAAAMKAKEAEAAASAVPVVAVYKIDLPPNYNEVTPGSPAPSYKTATANETAAAAVEDEAAPVHKETKTESNA